MGVPMLKRKAELNYRRGNTAFFCSICDHFTRVNVVRAVLTRKDLKCAPEPAEYRCREIGLEAGRQYRVHPKMICDRFDHGRYMKRLKGE